MLNILIFIAVLSLIVLVHELGHLISAKIFNVYCKEFAIGMGPKLFSIKGKETEYSIRLLPFGGFVSMLGEEGVEAEGVAVERSIQKVARPKRLVIMLAGIFMNFVLALVILFSLNLSAGQVVLAPKPVFGAIMEGMPAEAAGMQEGDRILSVEFSDGTVLVPDDFYDVIEALQFYNDEMTFTLERSGSEVNITLTPIFNEEAQNYMIGVKTPAMQTKEIGFLGSIQYAFDDVKNITSSIVTTFSRLIKGLGLNAISGPVGIYQITAQTASYGFNAVMYLVALLSINIAIFNLLPLPILDGGRSLLIFIELIRGKPMNEKIEQGIMVLSMALLLMLFIFISIKDVFTLF